MECPQLALSEVEGSRRFCEGWEYQVEALFEGENPAVNA